MIRRSAIAALAVSASLLVGVVVHEGFRDTAYIDAVGVPTIGAGRTEGVKPGQRTTVEREVVLLLKDLDGRKRDIAACVRVPLLPARTGRRPVAGVQYRNQGVLRFDHGQTLERRGLCRRLRRDPEMGLRGRQEAARPRGPA